MFRILLMISVVMSMAACLGGGLDGDRKADGAPKAEARKRHPVFQGQVTIAGPEGYCVDVGAVLEGDQGAFVPLGACASITGRIKDGAPSRHLFLSAVVNPLSPDMPKEAVVPAALKALELDSVRATLADKVLEVREENDALIVHSHHTESSDGLAQDQWRAVFACRDHVVALTVTGFEGQEVHGEKALFTFLAAMRKANPEGKSARTAVPSLLGRLLN
ncbi:hypothetical protein [Aliiroseovarius crassostreae]|uniref:hypothetical protein n=1 Tax=Aliiroseovarius crassostreae TaxID=154981 RepID=UPI003C79D835